ncbi:MAG: ATP-binding protein [Chitinophagia bacterium]|nr:ATP-binding protein [Chitinophagia bacterium]
MTASDTGTSNEKCIGMGLKMVFEYLAGIGGSIDFRSNPGQGTTVEVKWPE